MSIQTLLPRDTLLRQIAICFDDEDLPVSFRVGRGKVRDRNSDTLKNSFISKYIKLHLRHALEFMGPSVISMSIFDCNLVAWKVINNFLFNDLPNEDYFLDPELSHDILPSLDMVSTRLGYWVPNLDSQRIRDTYEDQLKMYHRFMSVATHLELVRDTFLSANNEKLGTWKRDGCNGVFSPPDPYSKLKQLKYYQVGTIVILKMRYGRKNQEKKYRDYVLTNTHYSRVIDYFKSCAIMSLFLPDINGIDTSFISFLSLLRYQSKIALETPNGVGSVFKTARQILFLRGDNSNIMGSRASTLFISGLTGVKEKYGESAADYLMECTGDRKSALNLANIFRIVPHPDAEMSDVFDSIKGFSEPNKVDEKHYPRFIGNVRKTVYLSLVAQRFDVRAVAREDYDRLTQTLSDQVNRTETPISEISKHGFHPWSKIRFQRVRGLFDSNDQDIPVSNKSSAPNAYLSKEEIKSIGTEIKLSDYKVIKKRLKAVNDVATVIANQDELSFRNARRRFSEVVELHESFEREYLDKGTSIDDIPSEDLADFVISNRDASYTVLTEPKLGEVHKEVTRLFYMAEQALKIMTQVTERSVKKVISKAAGVSIVKTNRARRKEIEEMLNSYTGVTFVEGDDGEMQVVYISFDMSEFSKKFPQKLVRAIGEVLSELTGEDWMKRIDVFFRASVVYHNSRGYMGSQAGAKGGFEGFLNFIWTLAMKVVMDIATEASGVEGVLAVYSDDGLLRLYIDGSNKEVARKVKVLKRVFLKYGLIFHLDKTAVSREILEYLGLYGDKGMLIPTWVKEVMSIGKRKQTPGLETVYDKVRLYDAQCGAVIKASGPHYPSMISRTLLTVQSLRRLNRIVEPRVLLLLTIIPSSAGGFRVSSISESSLLSSVEGFSEFSADLELLSINDPVSCNAIAVTILKNVKQESEAEKSILTGSFLQTRLTDTSGLSIAMRLVEDAGIDGNVAQNPLTKDKVREILHELKVADNFSQKLVRELIGSLPEMIKYNKSLSLVKSSAALKFVTKDKIKVAQREDTRKCRNSISWWSETIESFEGPSGQFSARSFMNTIKDRLYPSYNFSNFKDSPRISLIPCEGNPDIVVTFEVTENDKITEQTYIEPKYKGLGVQLSPEISAETTFNTERRMEERFINTAARLVATNSSLINLYYIVANAFSLPCPSLSSISSVKSHKSSRNFGMEAVHTILPAPFHSLVSSCIGGRLYDYLKGKDKRDRSTYTEASRIAGYMRASQSVRGRNRLQKGCSSFLYRLRDIEVNTSNPTFRGMTAPRKSLVRDRTTRLFTDLIIEESAQMRMLDSVIATNGLIETIRETSIVKAILLSRLTKWMRSTLMGPHLPRSIPFHMPTPWARELIVESAVTISFLESGPLTRRVVQLNLSRYLRETRDLPGDHFTRSNSARFLLNECLNNRQSAFKELDRLFTTVIKSVSSLGIDERMRDELSSLDMNSDLVIIGLLSFLKRKSVTGGSESPTVLINSNTFADTKMSRELKTGIKNIIDSVLCSCIDSATRGKGEPSDYDYFINYLTILKNMLRPSGHRSTPFNKHMMMIQLIKAELFIGEMIEIGVNSVSLSDLEDFRLSEYTQEAIMEKSHVIRGDSEMTSGTDMREELCNKGVHTCMLSRVNYILRELVNDDPELNQYNEGYITEENIINDGMSIQNILNGVLVNYNSIMKGAMEHLEIRHSREADIVTNMTTLTPVEESRMIMANVVSKELIGYEIDIRTLYKNDTYSGLISNLLYTHQLRWSTGGYTAYSPGKGNEENDTTINNILNAVGVFGPSVLRIGDKEGGPLRLQEVEDEYYLHSTTYNDEERAVHNYLYINRLHGGMAVIGKDEDHYVVLGVIPKGTKYMNTTSASVPEYINGYDDKPVVYKLEIASQNLSRISEDLGIRANVNRGTEELHAVVIRQTYQRIIGARRNPENEDHFLVAMAEMVRGTWSLDIGMRIITMLVSWMTCTGEVTTDHYMNIAEKITRSAADRMTQVTFATSLSACWEWLKLMNISAGPDIDSSKVSKIIGIVSRIGPRGGRPISIRIVTP